MDLSETSFAFADLKPNDRYKILIASVVPRPIALVTSLGPGGIVNAAPFSFFNVFSEDPAIIVLGLQHRADHTPKDTTRNIAEASHFVVHTVDESIAEAMNLCSIDAPPDVSELELAGLTTLPSIDVPVPRIAEAPFAFECRRIQSLVFAPQRELLIGEIVRMHARDGLFDPATMKVDMEAYHPLGRMEGNYYTRQRDRVRMVRPSYADWLAGRKP